MLPFQEIFLRFMSSNQTNSALFARLKFIIICPVVNREPIMPTNSGPSPDNMVVVVVQSLCDPMDCSTPGFPVLHYFSKFAQTHVHWVGDATQQSRSLSPSSPSALNLSQDHRLFQLSQLFLSGGQSAGASASVLSLSIQGWHS